MHKIFIGIHFFINRNKVLSAGIALGLLLLFGYFASKINFEEDITRLIPKNEKADVATKVLSQLNFSDKITVIINAKDGAKPEDLTRVANVFLDSLQSCKQYINSIQGKVEDENIQETFDFVYNNLPLFLDDEDYNHIALQLQPDSIAAAVNANYRSIISPSGLVTKDFILKDPFGISFTGLKKLRQLGMGDDFHLQDGYVITKDNQKVLLFISPKLPGNETKKNTLFVNKLDAIKASLNASYSKTAAIEYFGATNIAVANAKQIKKDIQTTTMIAVTLLMLILMVYYRKFFIPFIILIPTIFGVLFAVALLYFLRGTISAISLSIGSILLGVTIDYALHILTHYKHNSDIRILYKDITKPLIMSSSTTAVAFLCLLFVNSGALQDLGIFAAVSVMVTSLFTLLIIPHLYRPKSSELQHHNTILDKLAGFSFHQNKLLVAVSVLIIIISFFTFNKVVYDKDISQLNYVPDDIKLAEKHLEGTTNLMSKSLYVTAYGNDSDAVLQNNNNLYDQLNNDKKEHKLLTYSSIGGIVLSEREQQKKIDKWNSFWTPQRKDQVKAGLIAEGNKLGFKPNAYDPFYALLSNNFTTISLKDYLKVKALFLNEFITEKNGFYTVSSVVKVSDAQRDKVVSALSAKQKVMVIDRQQMNEAFLGGLKNDFTSLINYSFIAIVLILFLFFRRIELVIISSIPIIITGIVTTGIMAVFDVRLNIFSTIVCTLVLGHGVDFSIFMTSALQKEFTTGKSEMATYRTSILLAVLTTVLGIGALIFAGHPALKSISSVSLIGVFGALIITFVFYPILFRLAFTQRVKKGNAPFELRTLLQSLFLFAYYGLGSFMLSIISLLFVNILPLKKKWKIQAFRYVMSKFMKSVLYLNPFVKKTILNPNNETFDKPAIIIANHTSFLDILAIGMLSPKIIYLVSDWVYNSPVFGIGVKLAGFYPVSQGIEGGVEHLRKKVEEGYSLVVFPEGTRSKSNQIQRFHKGAFYLAQEFNLDIVPILIHGNSEVLPKGDFIIYDGSLTLKILDRIAPDNSRFGVTFSEKAKGIGAYFKEQFRLMRTEREAPDYFKRKILHSFAYKESDVVDTVKSNVKNSIAIYHRLNSFVGSKETILHIADNYGETSVLLALQEPQRKIYCYIENQEKREIAKTNYINTKRDIYYLSSVEDAEKTNYSVIIAEAVIINTNIALKAERIIFIKPFEVIVPDGFDIEYEEDSFVIARKR
ncbi:1-acyl-sn-glycerol-3-phosphate acyltransferase [Flavobacterium sp. NRK1]|uniref:1-acyl-sn-glycerol-3-phosphate acyltransferase n=1 Tax=Flavobacterium sp. NRK1 TaxID=2954929 RepID=UPI0020938AEB|nr:1-acyl-sn-glycerol-3-phosphate acyltransferase [Flavobacterium sp. NRK1]MCO6147272.1 MMPL family transporter [Flavobacterium sp. NRK1]